jgi:tetratricopeptide (TPR) repeat protein
MFMIEPTSTALLKRTRAALTVLVISAFALAACDLTVDNPGPTPDSELSQEIAIPSVVAGMERAMAEGLNYIAYEGAAVSLEINAAGSIGNFGISTAERRGNLNPNESNLTWELGHQARFTAEDGVARMREVLGDGFSSSEMAARALLWVGYSNRLLGANFCKAVIDGGPAQPNTEHFSRAEAAFTEALQVAQNAGSAELESAALAGRASVNVHQGDWADAVSDAQQVPGDFEYAIPYYGDAQEQYNRIYWANANEPYRAHTVADTYYGPDATGDEDLSFSPVEGQDYYGNTGDARVPYDPDPAEQFGDTGDIIWYPQLKYDARSSPITLSSSDEMMLILAENEIREGRWQDAMTLINDLRAAVPNDNSGGMGVTSRTASSETEAWVHLKRERGIELWMEARRLGDRRRWIENGVPGAQEDMSSRDLCWPISQTELESNPNVSPSDNDQDRAN